MKPGTVIGGAFQVRRALGGGASAEVFHALDPQTGLEVAIKLFPRSGMREEEFRREAGIAMRNVHSNLVRLVDAGVHEGRPWLALEYVDGINARALLYREGRTVQEVLDLVRQVLAALDAMHGAGLVHGDIKPENVLVQDRHVRVVDFGRTRLGHVLPGGRTHAGTPPYMHPSLYRGQAPTPSTDCFAAWVMAWELLTAERPWTREDLEGAGPLPSPPPLPDPALDQLLRAGLDGRLADARSGWLAISRHLVGRRDLPCPRPAPPLIGAPQVHALHQRVLAARSCAVAGPSEGSRPLLEGLDRAWRRKGGTALWVGPGWRRDLPLADALSMAAQLAEGLEGSALADIARELGPLAGALADAVPATRAWLPAGPARADRPEPERLALALRRMVAACPPPVLLLARAFDHVDGASRRLLRELCTSVVVHLAVGVPAGHEHGLAATLDLPGADPPDSTGEARLSAPARHLARAARILDLPLDGTLARALGMPGPTLVELAWDLEAVGAARWTGEEVLALPGPTPPPDQARELLAQAARNLDAHREPLLVARYALRGADAARLAEVIDPAFEAAASRDPAEALALCVADPRTPTPARLVRRFRTALLARDMAAAELALALLRQAPGASPADLAEAEGELHFRRGETLPAIAAYERAARALGRPVPAGLRGLWQDGRALLQVLRCKLPRPSPDPRLARILEALYDLRFNHDHAYLLRLHRLWLAAAPQDPRALAVEVLWRQLLGRRAEADALDRQLHDRVGEQEDPVGAAVVQMHRAIGGLLRGETALAFSDGVDAATRLLRAGDPYHAALAATLPTTCAIHVAGAATLAGVHRALLRLVADTGDERTARWAAGIDAVVRWQQGDTQGAAAQARAWAEGAARQQDASEVLARRFLAELAIEAGDHLRALAELERADAVARALHVRMDYTDARAITALCADAQARLAGARGLPGRRAQVRRAARVVHSSPRWEPRALVAQAMQAVAEGQREPARRLFSAATRAALDREQAVDAWWALHLRGRTLDDDDARAAAAALALSHQLRQGTP